MSISLAGEALLELLTCDAQAQLARLGQRKAYGDGELIHSRGDDSAALGIVIAGKVRLCRLHADGTQTMVSMVRAGQHFGDVLMFAAHLRRTHDAVAVGQVQIDHYDEAAFARALEIPAVIQALYRVTSQRLVGAMAMNDDLRSLPRDVHLVKMLLALSRGHHGTAALDIVQEDLAALLGASVMTVSKGLSVLRRAGLVETGYRQIRIVDRPALQQWLAARLPI
ncbi:MAG: Crp/Fnr family transcriptional regulator [Sphingomonadales bacterium]|nr:Crp/Fnr family transcriptional regulator [Sphingomonadales bacterium]